MKKFNLNQRIAVFSVLLVFCFWGRVKGQSGPSSACILQLSICPPTCSGEIRFINETRGSGPSCVGRNGCEDCYNQFRNNPNDYGCLQGTTFYGWKYYVVGSSTPFLITNTPYLDPQAFTFPGVFQPGVNYKVCLEQVSPSGVLIRTGVCEEFYIDPAIIIPPRNPLSMQILNSPICINEPITFVNTTTSGIMPDYWEINSNPPGSIPGFGGGVYAGNSVITVFTIPGNYACTLKVGYGLWPYHPCPVPEIIVPFTVLAPSISISGNSILCLGDIANFSANSNCLNNITWNFGDGGFGTGSNPFHTYTLPGTYSVTASGTGSSGGTITQTISVIVASKPAPVILAINPTTSMCGITGLQTYYVPSVVGQTYQWSLSGGTPASPSPRLEIFLPAFCKVMVVP